MIRRIFNKYRNMKLQSKLMTTYLIIISIPMIVIMLFFYGKVYDMIVSDTIRKEQEESAKSVEALNSTLMQILEDSLAIQNFPFYEELFSIESPTDLVSTDYLTAGSQFTGQVHELLNDSHITHVNLYIDMTSDQLAGMNKATSGMIQSFENLSNTYWRGILTGTKANELHCPSFYLSKQEIRDYGDLAYVVRRQIRIGFDNYTTYAVFYYSSDVLLDVLRESLPSKNSVAYIINDRDSLITSTNPALSSYYYYNYEEIQKHFMSSNSFAKKRPESGYEDIYAGMYNLEATQWYMVVVIPSTPLVKESNMMMFQYIMLFVAFIILAIILAILISRPITGRIAMLNNQMVKVRTGPPIPLPESDIHDEIGGLINTYNYMSREMNQLLKERVKSAEELRIAEFRSLQAQINPHFLYNTMDMINWMASQGRTDEIMDAVYSLSRFYKLTLSKKETLSTIADEIEHAGIYIRLQNMRFHDSVEWVVDVPDELLDYQIPKLTLQPVVENAVHHGIMAKDEKGGCIVLTGWIEGDILELLISDDGIGIEDSKLQTILTGEGHSKTGSNIAIYNIHQRIQILYGEQYGLFYQSTVGQGTEVSIRLPAKKPDKPFFQDNIIQISNEVMSSIPEEKMIASKTLLDYNEKLANDMYILNNLHEISKEFSPDEPFLVLSHHVKADFPIHSHNYFEFIYCCRGTVIHKIDGQEVVQSAGDVYLLNTKAVHAIKRADSDALLLNIALFPKLLKSALSDFHKKDHHISRFFINEVQSETNYLYFPLGHQARLQSSLSAIIHEYVLAHYHFNDAQAALLGRFFGDLAETGEYSRKGLTKQAFELLQYVQANCTFKSIEQISQDLYESPQSLASYLLNHTGRQLKNIVNEVKLNQAIELLKKSEWNLVDIMSSCGFESKEEFSRIFSEFMNITPEEYRKSVL